MKDEKIVKKGDTARVLVCQHGARHRYAIPRLLEESGLLTALYTDSSAHSGIGRIATVLSKIGFRQSSLNALVARKPTGIPRKKVFSSDAALHLMLKGAPWYDISPTFKRWGLKGANVVYNMCGEDYEFLRWAKSQGAKIIIDVFVHPSTTRIVSEENLKINDIELNSSLINDVKDHFTRSFELADVLVCPSSWVAEGVLEYSAEYEKKIRLVPYGRSLKLSDSINENPVKARILFAGRDPLRKGVHYLAEAARLVREQGVDIDVHIAGLKADEVEWIKDKDQLNCLGTIPLSQMQEEFRQADVFVLPSLSEGQAGVLLEAMACGCPVIATKESGVDFDAGSGVTVPSRNPQELAAAIISVLGSRGVRNEFAQGALKQSAMFSTEAWKDRLDDVVNEVLNLDKESE